MGFSVVAGTAILMLAGVAAFGLIVVQSDAADDAISDAKQAADARDEVRRHGGIDITATQYQPGPNRLIIDLTNTGSATFTTADIEVLVDGVVHTDDITWIRVDGVDAAYWAPLLDAEIRLDGITSTPSRVMVVTGEGITDFEVV